MASNLQRVSETGGEAPMRVPWESMSLNKIGKFEDIIKGGGTLNPDGNMGSKQGSG